MKLFLSQTEFAPGSVLMRARGSMSPPEAAFLLDRCTNLPAEVQTLHVDLRELELLDPSALATVQTWLVRWHMTKTGVARVEFSALSLRSSVREMIRRRTRDRAVARSA